MKSVFALVFLFSGMALATQPSCESLLETRCEAIRDIRADFADIYSRLDNGHGNQEDRRSLQSRFESATATALLHVPRESLRDDAPCEGTDIEKAQVRTANHFLYVVTGLRVNFPDWQRNFANNPTLLESLNKTAGYLGTATAPRSICARD